MKPFTALAIAVALFTACKKREVIPVAPEPDATNIRVAEVTDSAEVTTTTRYYYDELGRVTKSDYKALNGSFQYIKRYEYTGDYVSRVTTHGHFNNYQHLSDMHVVRNAKGLITETHVMQNDFKEFTLYFYDTEDRLIKRKKHFQDHDTVNAIYSDFVNNTWRQSYSSQNLNLVGYTNHRVVNNYKFSETANGKNYVSVSKRYSLDIQRGIETLYATDSFVTSTEILKNTSQDKIFQGKRQELVKKYYSPNPDVYADIQEFGAYDNVLSSSNISYHNGQLESDQTARVTSVNSYGLSNEQIIITTYFRYNGNLGTDIKPNRIKRTIRYEVD